MSFILAQTAASGWYMYAILGGFFVLMIVMTVIPQRKQKKKMQEMMSSITIGDKIMTIGGFVGTIVEVNEDAGRYIINIGTEEAPVNVTIVKNAVRSKL
ncbi:MAG: preprotein translocase subunit YajC [Clostridiales bacterium]|jgi:preprotein translocase subunit YajC|nr:preprotein translocase subunit YajC [Clostridiales bacterium]HOB64502.1 preprotein translocase subunit YajC [Clostridia bacterium]HOK81425.1 preprotein translocase subunit YajC [Clostridia bacterium]HOL60725.1 preprotein translocase subunit YajC [Clostridia bacterium]HPO53300.1 preprotein translocase subunit YajC [Clostridia bacterium]